MTAHIRKLVDHLAWADAATLRSLRDAPNAGGRTLQLYAHIVAAESVWLARIAGRSPDVAVWPALSLDDAAALAERNARELDGLAGTLGAGDLDRAIVYRNSAGREFRSTLGDILLHISLHGTYHRGQIALLIRDGGGEPAPTDYIAFARGAPAARTTPPPLADQPR